MAELLKKTQGLGRSQRRIFYCLAMVIAVVLLLWTMLQVAVPAYAQVCKLWQERALEQERLLKLKEFAARHADYSAYEEGRYRELVRLKQGLQRLEDGNLLQRQLQLEAVKRGLALKNMQAMAAENTVKGSSQQLSMLKLELAGEYFALLGWLKQVEKQRLTIDAIEIKGVGTGLVQAKLSLSYPRLELSKGVQDK